MHDLVFPKFVTLSDFILGFPKLDVKVFDCGVDDPFIELFVVLLLLFTGSSRPNCLSVPTNPSP